MSLTIKQLKAAQLIGKGSKDKDIWPNLGISEATYYGWKKKPDFKQALEIFTKAELERSAAIAAAAGGTQDIEQSREDEFFIREQIRPLAEELCGLAKDLIEHTRAEGVESLSPRMIPGLVNSVADAVKCLRDGNDRLSGLEALLDELGKIEAQISDKVVSIASGGKGSAA
ncbi:MAG: hypothetical protein AAFO06_04545 [Cyanobacteria bacterium J06597_16]